MPPPSEGFPAPWNLGGDLRASLREFARAPAPQRRLAFTSMLSGTSMGLYNFTLVLYLSSLHSTELFGALMLVTAVANAAALLPAGRLADRVNVKAMLLASALLSASGMALYASDSLGLFAVAAALAGVANALMQPAVHVYVGAAPEASRKYILGMKALLQHLGFAAAFVVAGAMPALLGDQALGSRAALLLGSALALCAAAWMLGIEPHRGAARGNPSLPSRRSLKFAASTGLIGLGAGLTIPYFQVYFRDVVGIATALTGLVFAASTLLIGVFSIALAHSAARLGSVRLVTAAQAMATALLFLFPIFAFPVAAAVTYVARNVLMNATGPVGSAFLLSRVREDERGLASSVNQGSWMLFNGVGTFLGGFLWSQGAVASGAWAWAFAGTAAFYALNTVLYYRWFRSVDDTPSRGGGEPAQGGVGAAPALK